MQLIPLADHVAINARIGLLLFFSVVIAILLIVCLNVACCWQEASVVVVRLRFVLHWVPAGTRRAPEFGIRIALGAQPVEIAKTALRHGLIPALCGLVIGIPIALLVSQALQSLLFGVQASDPRTYII